MLNPRQILRMTRWARHPPSSRRVKMVIAVFALVLLIAGIERFVGWPEILTADPRPRLR